MNAKPKKLLAFALALAMGLTPAQGMVYATDESQASGEIAAKVTDAKIDEDGKVTLVYDDGSETPYEKAATKSEVAATCEKDGTITYTITIEGQQYKAEFPGETALGHDMKDLPEKTVVTQATCETPGVVRQDKKCSRCDYIEEGEEEETEALGHKYSYSAKDLKNIKSVKFNDDGTYTAELEDKSKDGTFTKVTTCANKEAHEGTNPKENEETVKATIGMADAADPVVELIKDDGNGVDKTNNVQLKDGKPILIDCSKAGKYNEVTYATDGETKLKTETKTIKAGHTPRKAVFENLSQNLEEKNGKVINKSCAKEGTYDEVVYCDVCKDKKGNPTEISRKKVTVAKSNNHTPAKEKKYENDTATCQKAGTIDEITVCAVCGEEISRKQIESAKKDHEELDPVIENEKAPTAHQEGSYESVVYCKWGGEELSRKIVKVPATNRDQYTWSYKIEWSDSYAFVGNEDDGFLWGEETPEATLVATPTDSDLSKDQITALTYREDLEVKEVTEKATKGDACHMSSKTFAASVDAKYDVTSGQPEETTADATDKTKVDTVKLSSEQAYNVRQDGYKGHKFGPAEKVVLEEATTKKEGRAVYRRTCSVCGETFDDYYENIPKLETKNDNGNDENGNEPAPIKQIDLSKAVISGTRVYRDEYANVPFTVTLNGKTLVENRDFVVTNPMKNNYKGAGTHGLWIEGINRYKGSAKGKLTITKATQNITVTPSKMSFKASSLTKKAASFKISVSGAKTKVTFKSNKKAVKVSKSGKVTIKKGTKAGVYKITVKAKATRGYKGASKKVKITVK